jgi:flagellar motor switch protein FliM
MLVGARSASCLPNSKVFACVRRSEDYRISRVMEPNWTKVDFKNPSGREAPTADRLRGVHEALARDLSISLSTFLRSSVTAGYAGAIEMLFSDFLKDETPCCFGLAMIRPQHCRLLLQVAYSVLFPTVGIALGAKPGSFTSPERKPTEIELQVINLLFRLLLSDAYRAWAVPLKTQLETVTLEVEPRPARTFAATDQVFVTSFSLSIGEHAGQFSLVVPSTLFGGVTTQDDTIGRSQPESGASADTTIELMMPAKVVLDVWLDGSEMRLGDLMQLSEGQIVKLDHPVERKAVCTLNGKSAFTGQIVSTGARRAFMLDDLAG